MSHIPQEIQDLIFQEDLRVEGIHVAELNRRAMHDENWKRIVMHGYDPEIASQIYSRMEKGDFDYKTPVGGVISNVCFPHVIGRDEESVIGTQGRTDLSVDQLLEVTADTMVRPKLPGYPMTRRQVIAMGRRTCYDIVERVGDSFYGLYPDVPICSCCRHNTYVRYSELVLQPWHEGMMVKLGLTEYRVRKNVACDKIHEGHLWEMEKVGDQWIPVKPRGLGKKEQREKLSITTAMLPSKATVNIKLPPKRWMSKVLLRGQGGWVLINQQSGWDLVGGKQELEDKTPQDTLRREYKEELKVHLPPFLTLGTYETDLFLVYLYYVEDMRFKTTGSLESLQGVQKQVCLEALSLLKKIRVSIINSDYQKSLIDRNEVSLVGYCKKIRKQILRVNPETTFRTKLRLNAPVLFYDLNGERVYKLPCTEEEWHEFRSYDDGDPYISLVKAIGKVRADRIFFRKPLAQPLQMFKYEDRYLEWYRFLRDRIAKIPVWDDLHEILQGYVVRSEETGIFLLVPTKKKMLLDENFDINYFREKKHKVVPEDLFPRGLWSDQDYLSLINGE